MSDNPNVGKVFNLTGGGGGGGTLKLQSLTVRTPPNKTIYKSGEAFDPTGMVVEANYGYNLTSDVTGYTVSPTVLTEGVTEVTISYAEGRVTKTATTLIYGYVFPNGTSEASANWTIDRAVISALPTQSNVLAADGTPKSPTWDNYVVGQLTMSGDQSGIDAGDYTVHCTPTANYKWWDGSTAAKDVTWTITSVIVPIPTQKNIPTYTGAAHTPTWDNYDTENCTVQVLPATNAGEHTATFTLLRGMWSDGTTAKKTVKWTIKRATIAAVPKQSGTLKYDGNTKTPTWDSNYDSNKMTVSVEAKINAGTSYTASFTPDSNHCWPDGTTTAKTATWSIGKGDNTLTVSPTSVALNMSTKSTKFTATRKGSGTISATSSNTGVATIGNINQTTGEITINSVNDTSGTATITVKVAEDSNYLAPSNKTVSVTASFREYLYGYDLNVSDSNPATRVSYPSDVENKSFAKAVMNFGSSFNYGGWPSTPGQKFMPRPCMLKYDGTVAYYLNPNDYTKKADGTASDVANINFGGNAMMEWPKIYVKRWESNGVYHFRCSDVKVDSDYECWSNYDKNNKEIPHFYTPIFFGSKDSSGRMRSISGQANMVSTTAQQEIDAAKLNGANIWYTEVLADRQLINDLLTMMFKSTDLQTTAGMGVVSASAAIAPGTMNTKGMFWGSNDKTSGVKVFGMENWWGNIWRRIAGWMYVSNVQKVKLTRGTKDGSTVADYNITGDGYISLANSQVSGDGYISGMKTERHGRYPTTASGSSTTYEADYIWRSSGTRYALVGGSWSRGLDAGPFYVNLSTTPSATTTNLGGALSCKPLAAA